MAEGLSVSLPLRIDPIDGAYGLNKRVSEVASQNLKMIILTSPGERIMYPEFGVGVKQFLFEQNTPGTISAISGRIRQQVSRYAPYIKILDLTVQSPTDLYSTNQGKISNRINIVIKYSIPSVGVVEQISIPVSS
jgi:phage baseplate assembly protein W|tara:strand:- start:1907 stop:2311 length:405 start_codon:yes stop_codon:yes gene_type:complete